MELRLKRNSDIIEEGRERAYELIEQNITSFGEDGAPLLVRYRGEDGKLHTIIVIIGPDGAYSTFEDNNHGKTVVTSVDESVRVSGTTDGYDLSILSPEIIEYLNGLFEYKYSFAVDYYEAIVIDLTTTSGYKNVNIRTKLKSTKSNGKGDSKNVEITSSECTSEGWEQISADEWGLKYDLSEDDYKKEKITNKFVASASNADGKSGSISKDCIVTFNRWWMIIEHDGADITEEEMNSYLTDAEQECVAYKGKTADKLPDGNVKWTMKSTNYFWVCVPYETYAYITQSGKSVVNSPKTVSSKYGKYYCFRSISAQRPCEINDVDIKIIKL